MQYTAFEKGIEVNGRTVWAIVDGFKTFEALVSHYLREEGIGTFGRDAKLRVDPDGWYSQEAWLRAFEKIGTKVGESVLFDIGQAIPRNAQFPPWVNDVHSAVKSVDVAYHMNHRKGGKVMFDPADGEMLEGIGHYGYEAVADAQRIISVCRNPYPCRFDHGILTTMATKFEPDARVHHDDTRECRRVGAESCTYVVEW